MCESCGALFCVRKEQNHGRRANSAVPILCKYTCSSLRVYTKMLSTFMHCFESSISYKTMQIFFKAV